MPKVLHYAEPHVAWVVVDKFGNMQGVDADSGGYPWTPGDLGSIRYWSDFDKAQQYCDTMNRGGGHSVPYSVKRVRLQEDI